jgi:catechol 2,3-dioxygenase-like lactoylglutathione lyase family enzyme
VVLNAPDALALAQFYERLLGWRIAKEEPDWVTIAAPDSESYLAFQTETRYVRPVWPAVDGLQQMMLHLDLAVDDLEASVTHAVASGATLADYQPQDDVRVMLDPAGHPFCLYLDV